MGLAQTGGFLSEAIHNYVGVVRYLRRTRSSSATGFLGHGFGENPRSKEVGEMVQSRKVKGQASAGAGPLAPG